MADQRKTYAELVATDTIADSDLLATFPGSGPLKQITAGEVRDYMSGDKLDKQATPDPTVLAMIAEQAAILANTGDNQSVNIADRLAVREDNNGGEIGLPAGKITVNTGFDVPSATTLGGAQKALGEVQSNRDFQTSATVIWLDPGETITLRDRACLQNVVILNSALTYPILSGGVPSLNQAAAMAQVANFSGVAVRIQGDDCTVENLLIIGFGTGVLCDAYTPPIAGLPPGPSRLRINNVWGDCNSLLDVSDSYDVCRPKDCQSWNFFTGHMGYTASAVLRDGIAYNFHDRCDGLTAVNLFDYGHKTSFRVADAFSVHLTACHCDSDVTVAQSGSIGLLTEGDNLSLYIDGFQADSHETNVYFKHTTGYVVASQITTGAASSAQVRLGTGSSGLLGQMHVAGPCGTSTPIIADSGVGPWTIMSPGVSNTLGGVRLGNWNANTNSPALTSSVGTTDTFYYVSVAGSTNLNGTTSWLVGDIAYFFGGVWVKILGKDYFGLVTASDISQFQFGPLHLGENTDNMRDNIGARFHSLRVGTGVANQLALDGAASGLNPRLFPEGSDTDRGISIGAKGTAQDVSGIVLYRGQGGTTQLLCRFDAANTITPATFLFRGMSTTEIRIAPEGAQADINLALLGKGLGRVTLNRYLGWDGYASMSYASDAAAAAGGVNLGEFYQNAGALRVRIA